MNNRYDLLLMHLGGMKMEQLDLLWRYQEIEIKIYRNENDKKNSPARQKLVRIKNYLFDLKSQLNVLDQEAQDRKNSYILLNKEYEEIQVLINIEQEKTTNLQEYNSEEVAALRMKAEALLNQLHVKEAELIQLIRTVNILNNKLKEISLKSIKARKDYNELKIQYDDMLTKYAVATEQLILDRDQAKLKIDENLIKKYQNLKTNKSLAMAAIDQEKCSGCNMSLPSLVVRNVKDAKKIVECENCGRILYLP